MGMNGDQFLPIHPPFIDGKSKLKKMHGPLTLIFFSCDFFLVDFFSSDFFLVRQTDRQTDARRRIRAHRAWAQMGSIKMTKIHVPLIEWLGTKRI